MSLLNQPCYVAQEKPNQFKSDRHPNLGLLWCLLFFSAQALGARIEYKADFFRRDLGKKVTVAKGNAWVKMGGKQIWADEIEIDFSRNLATARGNVHIKERELDAWCQYANYNLAGEDAILEEATLSIAQVVLTGNRVKRFAKDRYEITDGTYTNCNIKTLKDPSIGQCDYDWKIYGRKLSITLEAYAHIQDAIAYVKRLPVMYIPYIILPIKTKRQSGILTPRFGYTGALGNTITIPYFLALGRWHDLELIPSYHTKRGYHVGFSYRYVYSPTTQGSIRWYFLQRRFSPSRSNPAPEDTSRSRTLGFIGEASVNLHNMLSLGGRAHSRQILRLVSDPYYVFDYGGDVPTSGFPFLRSKATLTYPKDSSLLTARIEHYQSLIIPQDTGVDEGAITKFPSISYSRPSTPFLGQYLSYELDANFTNFYRTGNKFDQVPPNPSTSSTTHSDPDLNFDSEDYVRVGRRIQIEPRIIANVPLPEGFKLQPVLKAGSLLYHFDIPTSQFVHREYAEIEIPASLYLTKTFSTPLKGYESINHVFQPRFIYSSSLIQTGGNEGHPFFYRNDTKELSNPRFDILDQLSKFEYMRFELINRFRRKTKNGVERFFLLQVSEQYNTRIIPTDPRFVRRLGPIEILSEFRLWRFTGQLQAQYQLEKNQRSDGTFVRENNWSSSLTYADPIGDRISLTTRFSTHADRSLDEKTAIFGWYKTLPIFFDVDGDLEYSMQRGDLVRFRVGFHLGSKPHRCWNLSVHIGRNVLKQSFANVLFNVEFSPL